jgi:succinyl-diaminopimelate desuccinylase
VSPADERSSPSGGGRVDGDAVVDLTRRLVRIRSVNRPEVGLSEAPAAELVAETMRGFGWDPIVEEVMPGRPNVIVRIDGGSPGPTLMFEGHTDVVTEGDVDEWSVDPFGGDVVEGLLYGRGAADMKGGVAAMIHAVRAVEQAGPFPGTIVIGVLCDEEGMMIGVKDFVARGHADGVDGVIVCEPEAGEVCTTQKGAIRLRIDARGVMAHGAMPHEGRNPIVALARLCPRLEAIQGDLQRTHGEHEHLGWPYVTATVLVGGSLPQMNVIPSDAMLAIDVRTVPGIDHAVLLDRVREEMSAVAQKTGVDLTMSVIEDRPATETPSDDPVVSAVVAAHEAVRGETPRYGGVPGTTDGTILWRDAGLPVVVYGPGGKWIAHQVDEYVEVDDLINSANVYAEAALRFLNG